MPKKPWDPDPREDLDPRNWFDARPDPWEEPRRFTDEREPPPPRPQFPKEPTGTTLPNLPFRWQDIYDCYPMPEWVRERIESYPQQSVGDALDDPLPVPFTAPEVKDALREVCEASFSRPSGCSPWAQPGSVHIALEVLRILQTRNGGWIRIRLFRSPEVGWPEVPAGAVFDLDLECQLVKLVGKPLPHEHCRRAAPAARLIYEVDRLTTAFRLPGPGVKPLANGSRPDLWTVLPLPDSEGGPWEPQPPMLAPEGRPIVVEEAMETPNGVRRCYYAAPPAQGPGPHAIRPPILLGCDVAAAPTAAPEPFDLYSHGTFELTKSFGIKEGCACRCVGDAQCG